MLELTLTKMVLSGSFKRENHSGEVYLKEGLLVPNSNGKTLLLLKPRGFCAGVVRAIDIVRIALEAFGPPIYVRKEIVHNRFVVEELQGKGAIFVDNVDEVPNGERVIYSAHGVSPEVREASQARNLRVIEATCPLVTKVHVEAVKFAREGYSLILIGHHDHDEVIGTLGEAPVVTQVVTLKAFYSAEAYHQDYAANHPNNPYIVYNDAPKVAHLHQQFPELYTGK